MSGPDSTVPDLRGLCAAWLGDRDVVIEPVVSEGFSGSRLYQVCRPTGAAWMLKSCAAGAVDRVGWAHGLMRHLRDAGLEEVPVVMATPDGRTLVSDARGTAWELVERMSGVVTDSPTPAQAVAAARCLARIHRTAASMPGYLPRSEVPAAVRRRIALAEQLRESPWSERLSREPGASAQGTRGAVVERLERAVAIFAATDGAAALRRIIGMELPVVPVQAVLRDVWSDHVLYASAASGRIAGIVDFHAAGIDTPATDIARLVGSWRSAAAADAPLLRRWGETVAAYESVRTLSHPERNLIPWLHATGVLFGLDNWFRWLLAESREFVRPVRAVARIDRLLSQLPAAISGINDHGGDAV
ncbi:MAG: phosphotransferase [Planctomycetia bacterium]|nr:phosphotransferase [Planctomycetia bacterium]